MSKLSGSHLYIPKSSDNPYKAWQYDLMTVEEIFRSIRWYRFSLRSWHPNTRKWSEEARCGSRESAYQIMKALEPRHRDCFYVIVLMSLRGKDGREKPVVFSPSESYILSIIGKNEVRE
jgi:hypothetical protein